jgi:hypothetical protein
MHENTHRVGSSCCTVYFLYIFTDKELMMKIIRYTFSILVILGMALGLMGPALMPTSNYSAQAHPMVLQIAAEAPDQMVSVIVQEAGVSGDAAALVKQLGGRVTKDLHIINAFAADTNTSPAFLPRRLTRQPGRVDCGTGGRAISRPRLATCRPGMGYGAARAGNHCSRDRQRYQHRKGLAG